MKTMKTNIIEIVIDNSAIFIDTLQITFIGKIESSNQGVSFKIVLNVALNS
jgi:hypothetical protein